MKTREIDGVIHFLVPIFDELVIATPACIYCDLGETKTKDATRCDKSCGNGHEWVDEVSFVTLTLTQGK